MRLDTMCHALSHPVQLFKQVLNAKAAQLQAAAAMQLSGGSLCEHLALLLKCCKPRYCSGWASHTSHQSNLRPVVVGRETLIWRPPMLSPFWECLPFSLASSSR